MDTTAVGSIDQKGWNHQDESDYAAMETRGSTAQFLPPTKKELGNYKTEVKRQAKRSPECQATKP